MNPDEMQVWLDKAVTLAKKGYAPEKIGAWLKSRTNGQFSSGQELSQAIVASRPAPDVRTRAEKLVDGAGGFANTYMQGAAYGGWDEAKGALDKVTPGAGGYRDSRNATREIIAQFQQEHPWLAKTAETAGMGTTALLTSGLLPAAVGGGYLANAAVAGATGGLMGQVSGALQAPELSDVPSYAAAGGQGGALLGGGLGLAVPPLAWGASKGAGLAGSVADYVKVMVGHKPTLQKMANARVIGALSGEGMSGAQAVAPLDRAVELELPMPIVADANAATARVMRAGKNVDPSLETPIRQLADAREGQRAIALARGLEKDRGLLATDARSAAQNAPNVRRAAQEEIYGALDGTVVPESSGIGALLDDMAAADPAIADAVRMTLKKRPGEPVLFQHIQAVKEEFQRQATRAFTKGDHSLGETYVNASKRLDAAMQEGIPGYRETGPANRIAKTVEEAYERGAKGFDGDAQAELDYLRHAQAVAGDDALVAYRNGEMARRAGDLRTSNPDRPGQATRNLRGLANTERDKAGMGAEDYSRRLWEKMFPTKEGLARFDERVALANQQAATEGKVLGGSITQESASDLNAGAFQAVAKTSASGPQSMRAGLIREMFDYLKHPRDVEIAGLAGRAAAQPYTPAVRDNLMRLMFEHQYQAPQYPLVSRALVRAGLLAGAAQ